MPNEPIELAAPFPTMKYGEFEYEDGVVRQQDRATPVEPGSIEYINDQLTYTNPNLHRRIDDPGYREAAVEIDDQKFEENEYTIAIHGVNSYRTTTYFLHSEDADIFENEIP